METKHLTYFKVENFKRFDCIEVADIGQFNLIVGDNNVGKTTLLEALLFDEKNLNKFQHNLNTILHWRKMNFKNGKMNFLWFFLNIKDKPIKYLFSFDDIQHELEIKTKLKSELNKAELEKIAIQIILNSQAQHLLEANSNNGNVELIFVTDTYSGSDTYIPFISFNMIYGADLVGFFSEISIETNNLNKIQSDIKLFIPELESIEVNNALIPQETVIAIREKGNDLIPLANYGDGTVKLFRYLLELEFCKNNRLMIDEIDTGIHYSRMKEFLKKVLENAKNKNVQIFATTHSKECIQYYTEALKELGYEKDGRIIKLADTKAGIKAYTYNFEQFENSLYAYSEIR